MSMKGILQKLYVLVLNKKMRVLILPTLLTGCVYVIKEILQKLLIGLMNLVLQEEKIKRILCCFRYTMRSRMVAPVNVVTNRKFVTCSPI